MRSKTAYPHPIFIGPAYKPKKQSGQYRTIGQLVLAIALLLAASLSIQHKAVAAPTVQTFNSAIHKNINMHTDSLTGQSSEKVTKLYAGETLMANTKAHNPKLQQVPAPKTRTWSNLCWWLGIFCFMGYLLMHAIRNEP